MAVQRIAVLAVNTETAKPLESNTTCPANGRSKETPRRRRGPWTMLVAPSDVVTLVRAWTAKFLAGDRLEIGHEQGCWDCLPITILLAISKRDPRVEAGLTNSY
jgi:hypothetical protein